MWGILAGCLGAVAVIGGFCGLIAWLTWPQDMCADDGSWLFDEVEDDEWKPR